MMPDKINLLRAIGRLAAAMIPADMPDDDVPEELARMLAVIVPKVHAEIEAGATLEDAMAAIDATRRKIEAEVN